MRTRVVVLIVALLASGWIPSQAQRPRQAAPGAGPPRAQLERRFRERLRQVMQTQLSLSDEQVDRLGEVNLRYEGRRRELLDEEVGIRQSMRRELAPGGVSNDSLVAVLLARSLRLQRQRITLIEEEQAELAQFLTPSQRARYFGLQEQLRQRIEQMREQRLARPRAVAPRRPPF